MNTRVTIEYFEIRTNVYFKLFSKKRKVSGRTFLQFGKLFTVLDRKKRKKNNRKEL